MIALLGTALFQLRGTLDGIRRDLTDVTARIAAMDVPRAERPEGVEAGRSTFQVRQSRAAVRRAPQPAIDQLRDMGYTIEPKSF